MMVRVREKVVITGLICLTAIIIAMYILDHDNDTITTLIIGMIGMAVGVVLPAPKIDNRRGVLIWQIPARKQKQRIW